MTAATIEQAFQNQVKFHREMSLYGCTIASFKESLEDSITFQCSGPTMCAMSLISDAQEEMARGHNETARKVLNRAKWILSEYDPKTLKL